MFVDSEYAFDFSKIYKAYIRKFEHLLHWG